MFRVDDNFILVSLFISFWLAIFLVMIVTTHVKTHLKSKYTITRVLNIIYVMR